MSCPCQPFSAAGKGGGFDDERHLWPFAHYLVEECRPAVVAGEQVASKDGLAWLDLVQADMEGTGYAFGAVDTCAAGFGAPHIRQRLYWMADADGDEQRSGRDSRNPQIEGLRAEPGGRGAIGWMGNARGQSGERDARTVSSPETGGCGTGRADGNNGNGYSDASVSSGLAHAAEFGRIGRRADETSAKPGTQQRLDGFCLVSGVADGVRERLEGRDTRPVGRQCAPAQRGGGGEFTHQPGTGPTNGLWRDADWLFCRDGKWRPVEPGTFPLAHGATARVGRLRGYGNAINAEQAQGFIEACIETLDGRFQLTETYHSAADNQIQDVFG
ncbi:DNA cytosine methyltransferase [Agrobacterium pusense]|uniref:DNA cytosine methyltransferase n=1 Tax=Agrobacterium pusense TaxID=648995 RepID=UPI0038503E77